MEQFNVIFEYLPAHHIAICKSHHQGVLKSQLQSHLRSHHRELPVKTRRAIALFAAAHKQWAETDREVIFPAVDDRPIPYLEVCKDGLLCIAPTGDHTQCGYIRRTLQHIQQHCKEEHGWKNSRKRGRQPDSQQSKPRIMWVEGVWCQKFQPAGTMGRLFQVSNAEQDMQLAGGGEEGEGDSAVRRAVVMSMDEATASIKAAEEKSQAQVAADSNRYEFNAWLNRAGWARHLKGLDRKWLGTLLCKPERHEKGLRRVCWAVEMVIWKAQQASRPQVVGMAAMNYINRREMGNHTNEKPFNARQTGKTMAKYSERWLEAVRYVWRTHAMPQASPAEDGEDDEDVEGKRPAYELTAKQSMWLRRIQAVAGRDEEDEWFDAFDAHGGGGDDEDDDDIIIDEEQEKRLEELVLAFMLALLDHVLGDDEYTSALMSSMAVMGIDADCGWISPLTYTPKQAAIVNVSRMLVLYRSTQMRASHIAQLQEEGFGAHDAQSIAHSHYYFVCEMANRFMTLTSYGGEPTPIDAIQRLKAYGMKIRFTTNAEGVVDWSGDTLLYGNIRFSMPQLRSMIHGLIASTRRLLLTKLMLLQVDDEGDIIAGTTPLPAIDWDRLVDNPAERKMGWSFMEDERNRGAILGVEDPKGWLGWRVGQERRLREEFIDIVATQAAINTGRAAVWNQKRVNQYRRDMAEVRQNSAALTHMTGGPPARGSELVTIQYKNSANGESRGTFIDNRLLALMTMYHKNAGSTGKSKVIHRYMPREVGELMVYYLWFAVPFWEKIEHATTGEPVKTSAYIWEPELEKAWARPQQKRKRPNDSSQESVRDRVGNGERSQEEGEGGEGEEDREERIVQTPTARPVEYRVELWNGNRVKNALQRASLEYMSVKMNIMVWRHCTKAIFRRYINSKTAVRAVERADEDDSAEDDEPFDLGYGHGSHVGGMIYGRPINEAVFSTETKRAGFREASREWHAFLQMPSTLQARPRKGTRAAAVRKEAREEEFRRWRMMQFVDVDRELTSLVGEDAKFRSVQRPAINAIMQHKSPIVAIMGTGAGKSILFMLPASVSSGVSIVIVPLVSLREDMKARCDRLGIACVEWNSRRPHEWAQVVLVTPESAVGEAFGHFINRQQCMGRLDRIVVDECHVVLDSLQGWRGRMLALRNLVRCETQLVYLTATLRPNEEGQFINLMGLPPKEQCQWFRGITTRKNIGYKVQRYNVDEEEEAIRTMVDGLQKKYPSPGQIIVYCDTVERTARLAEVLGCVCYHRTVGSSQEKKQLLWQLTSGQQQVFTATNALGLGIDAPTIRAVVHIGIIRKMRHYAQESGRAGRDGLPSEAIVMVGYKMTRRGPVQQKIAKDVEQEMRDFIYGRGCMRKIVDMAMDGRADRVHCEQDEEKCQHCQEVDVQDVQEMGSEMGIDEGVGTPFTPVCSRDEQADRVEFEQQSSWRKIQAGREAEQQARGAMDVEQLAELIEDWSIGCQGCRAHGVQAVHHTIWECDEEYAEEVRLGVEAFRARRRWAPYSCCFECGMPQSICDSFEVDITDGGYHKKQGRGCQYAGVLESMVFAIWVRHVQIFRDLVEEVMIDDGWVARTVEQREVGPGMEEVSRWFCEKKRWGGIESNKMSWFICRLAEQARL